jgi:immune inhibitor A
MKMKIKTMIVNLVILITLLLTIETVGGVPANPTPFVIIQPDSSSFQTRQVGDERGAHFETLDGYTVVKDEANWWNYAKKDENGKLISTGQRAGFADPKSLGLPKHLHPTVTTIEVTSAEGQITGSAGLAPSRISPPALAPQVGTKKALVILINFTDVSQNVSSTPSLYENLLFNASTGANSMHNYAKEVSYDKMNITGTIVGSKWYGSSYNMAYYGKDRTDVDDYNGESYRLICEAVSLANADNRKCV